MALHHRLISFAGVLAASTCTHAQQRDIYIAHGGANIGAPFGGEVGIVDIDTGAYSSIGTPIQGVGLTGLTWANDFGLLAATSRRSLIEVDPADASVIREVDFFGAGFGDSSQDRINDLATGSDGRV